MLIRPVLREVPIFDAGGEYIFKFQADGGEQVMANRLTVTRVSDNYVAYDRTIESLRKEHILPANTLSNGVNYRAQITTRNGTKDSAGQYSWSTPSNTQLFWCYFPPVLEILNIEYGAENLVRNQTFIFRASYFQANGEPLQSYRYLLYHADGSLLKSFDEQFPDGISDLTQEVTGLENEREYQIEIISNSPNGHSGSSGKILFRARYAEPNIAVTLDVQNRPDEGAIQISSIIIQILLRLYDNNGDLVAPNDIQYTNGQAIDLNRSDYQKIIADTGLYLAGDNFALQLWVSAIPDNVVFLKTVTTNGRLEIYKQGNKIIAKKYLDGLNTFVAYASNELSNFTNQSFTLLVRSFQGALDLVIDYV